MICNAFLLGAELLLYFAVLAALFRLRHSLGIGLFVTALGTMHFVETYLAATLYVGVPGGFVVSPGSSVLFAGKLVMLLLVYLKEDATAVRQPIYGLLVGNFLIVALVLLMRLHELPTGSGRHPDLPFLDGIGLLMVWGTFVLYLDSLAIVLVYEASGRVLRRNGFARIWLAAALVLTFDQVAFWTILHLLYAAGPDVLLGGWLAKMTSSFGYAVLTALYLRFAEGRPRQAATGIRVADLFNTLTFRERYHALLEEAGRDALTGVLNRNRLETKGRQAVDLALGARQEVSLLVIDVDGFKALNDRLGHATGDAILRGIASAIQAEVSPSDYVFRFGGDEFLVVAHGLPHARALILAEQLREAGRASSRADLPCPVGLSIGVATGPEEAPDFDSLFRLADERLYETKRTLRLRDLHVEPGSLQVARARRGLIVQA